MSEPSYIMQYNYVTLYAMIVTIIQLGLLAAFVAGRKSVLRLQRQRYVAACCGVAVGLAMTVVTLSKLSPSELITSMRYDLNLQPSIARTDISLIVFAIGSTLLFLVIVACVYIWPAYHAYPDTYGFVFTTKEVRRRRQHGRALNQQMRTGRLFN